MFISVSQIIQGIQDYKTYTPKIINDNTIIYEPNLKDQPKIYQNTEWFSINPNEVHNL